MERGSIRRKNCQGSQGPGVDFNQAPTEQKLGALPLQPGFLVTSRLCVHILEIVLTSIMAGQNSSNDKTSLHVQENSADGKEGNVMDIMK
jgi:hypothetical protein